MDRFTAEYVKTMQQQLDAIGSDAVERIAQRLLATAEAGAQILLAGNGGSAPRTSPATSARASSGPTPSCVGRASARCPSPTTPPC